MVLNWMNHDVVTEKKKMNKPQECAKCSEPWMLVILSVISAIADDLMNSARQSTVDSRSP